jgi:hypothetical protein
LILVGSKDPTLFRRFEDQQEVYEKYEVTIAMIDSSFWQVFAKNEEILDRLAKKFKDVMFLTSENFWLV